jgi:hypothetical protein
VRNAVNGSSPNAVPGSIARAPVNRLPIGNGARIRKFPEGQGHHKQQGLLNCKSFINLTENIQTPFQYTIKRRYSNRSACVPARINTSKPGFAWSSSLYSSKSGIVNNDRTQRRTVCGAPLQQWVGLDTLTLPSKGKQWSVGLDRGLPLAIHATGRKPDRTAVIARRFQAT